MDTKREDLLSYREEVLQELERRANRVKEIDAQITATQYALDSSEAERRIVAGQTLRILARVSYNARLKRELREQSRVRDEAVEDLKRAERRLADVDNELLELDNASVLETAEADGAEEE